ncbi:DUF927 domain-containing protein [Methylobacterium nigriterrae]|uniref:DUF927 domain-containing protein n=1 Tax=Methylobacterium nigriterrae TaxID=3127512 RepID=UPI0030133AB3
MEQSFSSREGNFAEDFDAPEVEVITLDFADVPPPQMHAQARASEYVLTKDAQRAVEGRETEILDGLGIDWRKRPHTDCPYPDHGGKKDWRWDPRKQKAFCTCAKAHSIFDVLAKIRGCDFDAAKIQCVEMLSRTDLIKAKGANGSKAPSKSDPDSLLNPPDEWRDDSLPRAYLAHRLKVEPGAVPMPATRAVGITAHAYYDAPAGKEKPKHVGDYPCAVFQSVGEGQRRHAHRIYLAPRGAGKADLGLRADGEARDPKKSARVPEPAPGFTRESISGLCVVWGDTVAAPHWILAEGIETSAAIALAFKEEIERAEIVIASAISANGVAAFTPWGATKCVTVAADRDEAGKNGGLGSRAGETAARELGIRVNERVAVAIAMPGEANTKIDWLDIFLKHGPEAVRTGILAAEPFTATAAEVSEGREKVEAARALQQVRRDYPLPTGGGVRLDYEAIKGGAIHLCKYVKVNDEGGERFVPVSAASPVGITARLLFVDDGDTYGLRIVVQDMNGHRRPIDVSRSAFAKMGASETRAMLLGAGMRSFAPDGEMLVIGAMKAAEPTNEIAVVSKPGWHTLAGVEDRIFVCPDGQVIGAPDGQQPELSVNAQISPVIARGGTLQGWQAAVAVAVLVPGCEHWVIGAAAGFAGCLISLTGLDTCGINFSGLTTSGKTTAQRLGVSAWSKAASDHPDSLLKTARATVNGTELMASRSTGTILAMDELAHVNGKEVGKIVYGLASGTGKTRMSENATQKRGYNWATHVVLSSEKSLEEKITGDGGEFTPGMAVRIPDIDVTGVNRDVDRETLEKIDAVRRNYGHAGPAFVQALVAEGLHRDPEQIRAGVRLYQDTLAGTDAGSAMKRAAEPFAILMVAGEMAREFGLLPRETNIGGAIRWAWRRFQKSSDAVALDPKAQVVASIRAWIAERWGSSIHPTVSDEASRVPFRDAVGWYDGKAVYIPAHRIMEASGNVLKETEVARALNEMGFIVAQKDREHLSVGYIPGIRQKLKAYALCRTEFGRG